MDYSKNKKYKMPPIKSSKIKTLKKAEKKSRIWLVVLGVLCILAGIVILISITRQDEKRKEGREIKVPYDIETVKNEQKSVDEGHSPWKLDPLFVTQVFVSLKISPDGIQGDYPIRMEVLKLIKMTKRDAVVQVSSKKTPITLVHLKRLVRADDTGIWTVVAYETAQENRENVPEGNQENREKTPEENKENRENVPETNKENKENMPESNKENAPESNKENKENMPESNKENAPETNNKKENDPGTKQENIENAP